MQILEEADLCFPQLLNSSCRKMSRSRSISVLVYMILSVISVLTVILNLLVIISISHFKQLHTPTNFFLLSLAVSDCIMGFQMIFQISYIDGCWYLGDLMCVINCIVDYFVTSAGVGTTVLISVDRYVAICYPLYYPSNVTAKRAKVCVSLCWMCSALFQSLLLKDNLEQPGRVNSCYGDCVVVVNYLGGFFDLFLTFIGPVGVIIILYVRVFLVVVSQVRATRSHIKVQASVKVTIKKSELKAATTLGVVVVVFLLCFCPYYCVTLASMDALVSTSSITFAVWLLYCNSWLNPLIYTLLYPWFRKSVKIIITLKILKPGSCNTSIM